MSEAMHKARVALINKFKEELKQKERLTHDEALKFLMIEGMIGRQAAERDIQDLLFIGLIRESRGVIMLPISKKSPAKAEE